MTGKWTGWETRTPESGWRSPYADWNHTIDGLHPAIRADAWYRADTEDPGRLVEAQLRGGLEILRERSSADPHSPKQAVEESEEFLMKLLEQALDLIYDHGRTLPPLPLNTLTGCNSVPPDCDDDCPPIDLACHFSHLAQHGPRPDVLKPGQELPPELKLHPDSVLVGVIDVGLPLGHRRSRMANGKTRVLAAWQQTAPRRHLNPDAPGGKGEQMYLPFGQEMLAPEIDRALDCYTAGTLNSGQLDEDAFNRATLLEDIGAHFGQMELARRAAHGAHVMDAATGMDAAAGMDAAEKPDLAALTRIIAVNLPERALVGHAAEFLEFFAIHAILRTVMLSDAIWLANFPTVQPDPDDPSTQKGFPLVINLSFGKHAEARDGRDLISDVMKKINDYRTAQGFHPVLLSMPAGNENLERGNVRTRIMAGAELEFDWRLLPQDQSANFVEIWSGGALVRGSEPMPIAVEVVPPSGPGSGLTPARNGQRNDFCVDGTTVARIYGGMRPEDGAMAPQRPRGRVRAHYVIATRQTQLYEPGPLAPAGMWKIRVRNMTTAPLTVDINVQTDQNARSQSLTNRRSYFEVPEYIRHDETGRVIDSYTYPLDGTPPQITDVSNTLRRHGTINAIGLQSVTATAAGYRGSDGRMEPYSGTGFHRPTGSRSGGGAGNTGNPRAMEPTAAFVIRDGAAHFGTLANGARDGSLVAMQGTSFGAAQLTRRLVEILRPGAGILLPEAIKALRQQAPDEDKAAAFPGKVESRKAGAGRMATHADDPDSIRHNRFGRS